MRARTIAPLFAIVALACEVEEAPIGLSPEEPDGTGGAVADPGGAAGQGVPDGDAGEAAGGAVTATGGSVTGAGGSVMGGGGSVRGGGGSVTGLGGGSSVAGTPSVGGSVTGPGGGSSVAGTPTVGGSAMGAGGSAGAAGAAGSCTEEIGSCPATSFAVWQVLLDAADFGPTARFVALGGRAVVVDRGDASYEVVSLLNGLEQEVTGQTQAVWTVPSGVGTPVAVALDGEAVDRWTVVVLVCDDAGAGCSLLRGDEQTTELSPWPGSELPGELDARALVLDVSSAETAVCAYGNGLFCFRDGWQAEIPVAEGLRLNHVSISPGWALAVGEEGQWFQRALDDAYVLLPWEAQPPLGTASLTWASTTQLYTGGVIVGEGRIQAALGEQREMYACEVPRELEALVLDDVLFGGATGITQTGEVLRHSDLRTGEPRYCSHDQMPAGEITAIDTVRCDDSTNLRVLLGDTLLVGTNHCVRYL